MGYFFLDIETYIDDEVKYSALNPFTTKSKVIAIAYNYYNEFKISEKIIRKPTVLKEWESGEKKILQDFYTFAKLKIPDDKHFKYLGFNCIKFDLSYLMGRLITHEIDTPENIYYNLFTAPHIIDLGQISQILSNNKFKEILNINQKTTNSFFDLPIKQGTGKDVTKFYNNKEFDKIEKYISEEFSFELLYLKLKRHIYKKETMIKNVVTSN
jgi:hypothetical protein